MRNKTRLYIFLDQLDDLEPCHWALALSKDGKRIGNQGLDYDSFLMYASGGAAMISKRTQLKSSSSRETAIQSSWKYKHEYANSSRRGTLIGKVLIAKLKGNETIEEQVADLAVRLEKVPVDAYPGWNCVDWAIDAVNLLGIQGVLTDEDQVDELSSTVRAVINNFAESCLARKQGQGSAHPPDVPVMDIRPGQFPVGM